MNEAHMKGSSTNSMNDKDAPTSGSHPSGIDGNPSVISFARSAPCAEYIRCSEGETKTNEHK
jgi:hypothetical protein